mgnify:CR=1 FL=1
MADRPELLREISLAKARECIVVLRGGSPEIGEDPVPWLDGTTHRRTVHGLNAAGTHNRCGWHGGAMLVTADQGLVECHACARILGIRPCRLVLT